MELTESLKRFRKTYNLKQKDVAEVLGVTPQAYQVYESSTTPSAKVIIKIAKAFGVSSDYLLGLSDNPQPYLQKAEIDFDEQESNELTVAAENDRILDYHQTLAHILAKQGIKI